MNKNIKRIMRSKASKRIVSGLTAAIMFFGMLPLGDIKSTLEDLNLFSISASAADDSPTDADETDERFKADKDTNGYRHITIVPSLLVEYSKHCVKYHKYHQYDIVKITTTGNEPMQAFNWGFMGLGSEEYPFGGSIEIGSSNEAIVLNLDAPLFNCVYDNVTLKNNGGNFKIAREFDLDQTQISKVNDKLPLLAKSVRHQENTTAATWNIEVVKPTAGNNKFLGNFGGFIGKMSKQGGKTSLTVNVTMSTAEGDSRDIAVAGAADNDLGLICGSMDEGTTLNFTLSGNRKVSSLTTSYGHIGGLVGRMESGAVLNYTGSNIQNNQTDIKTTASESYAGGIVGKNNGGTVKIALPNGTTTYPVTQLIEGTSGAGGVYGYYKPNDSDSSIDASKFSINCQVNGSGYDGGVFGVLDCSHNYSFGNTGTITSTHASGSATGYGGLIGRYNNSELSNKLEIGAVTSISNKSVSVSYYGGAIALIGEGITDEGGTEGGSAYVKFDGFTANTSGANEMTFGGIAAKADKAFVDANNITVNVNNSNHLFQGGAVVGSLEFGVLRLTGYTDITNAVATEASYKTGQIVGYRDNALVFAYSGSGNDVWKLKRPNTNISIDDIGSWGEVVRFDVNDTTTSGYTKYGFNDNNNSTDDTVITINETGHYVTVSAPAFDSNDSSIISVCNTSDFAKTALNMQLYDNQSEGVLQFDSGSDLSSKNIKLGADIDLSGIGISSFTRDNVETDSVLAYKCVYSGTFDGDGHSVTLSIGEPYGYHGDTEITDHSVEGSGKIYRHKYNGLFGITDSSSGDDDCNNVKNVTIKGHITVNAKDTLYVGAVAGLATGSFNIDNVSVADTVTTENNQQVHESEFRIEGGSASYVGGILGKASSTIGRISVSNCSNIKCNINSSNSSDDCCYGGVIGWIGHSSQNANWKFSDVTVSGSIKRTGKHEVNKLGGLVAAITEYTGGSNETGLSEREIELTNININGLAIEAAGSSDPQKDSSIGGLLGYTWLNVNPTFHNVQVSSSSVTLTDTASNKGDLAGLVYKGTGHWVVEPSEAEIEVPVIDSETGEPVINSDTGEPETTTETKYYDGIKINSITINSSNAKSFGMIINNGMASKSAIFLDIRADDNTNSKKSYLISSATLGGLDSDCIFDELVAYSAADGKVLENGQGIVSIHTGFTTNGTSSSKSYQAQTSRGAVPNDKTRYYYDLDAIIEGSVAKDYLMQWALNLYAHKSIRGYFNNYTNGDFSITRDSSDGVTAATIPKGTYDMVNYSWYPVNMYGVATIEGTFKFYNDEFEKSEALKGGTHAYARTSLYDTGNDKPTQHHLMHCGLFRNVGGGITIGTSGITLQGNVGRYGTKNNNSVNYVSGALVCGTMKGTSTSNIATFTTSGSINLSGISVHDHESNSYAPLLINKIGEFSTIVIKNVKAESGKYTDNFKAASSLIGDVGSASATNINLTFADIQIDGRTTSNSGAYDLDAVYNTKSSLFYRATLLNTFRYSSGSATYDFNIGDDWKESSGSYIRTGAKGVTYGSEIDDADSQHLGKEYWYKDTNGTSNIYTNYNTPSASGTVAPSPAISFAGFLPYVYSKSTASGIDSDPDKRYQIKVNWAETKMTGCGTYNDPYIITKGSDLENISKILSGTHSADVTVTLPNLSSGNTTWNATQLKQKKWDDNGDTVYTYNSTDGKYYCGGTNGYDKKVVQNYLAGAYYKIQRNKTIDLTSNYTGLRGDTEESTFRGVIVGNGETITLTGNNPLIFQSNGCVVKGINIVVDKSEISIEQKDSKAFSYGTSNCQAYGAVIGKIMGGDNIIDNVTVSFKNSKIKLKGNAAQTVPVGGYVGVVVKGSLVFRGMEKYRETASLWSSISGLGTTTVKDNSGNTDLLYTDAANKTPNMKWLYVNPIVGRVLNAAVFTEGDAYRPFENGTREGVYIKKSASEADPENIVDYRSVAVDTTYEKYSEPVTMQNGTKNYSIADITDNLGKFVLNDVPERTSTFGPLDFRHYLKIDISVPNAQSLYVMSLVTQAGLGGTNYLERYDRGRDHNDSNYYPPKYNKPIGGFANTGNYGIAPYYSYRSTHVGQYTYVGSCGGSGVPEPTESEDWYSDYSNAKTDNAQFNRSGGTSNHSWQHGLQTIPYIIGKYTPKINSDTTGHPTTNPYNDTNYYNNINGKELGYIAFCLTQQYSYLNLTFSASNSVYYMPDGFRGLGCLGYKNFISTDNWTTQYQDMIIHIFGIKGNGNTVDLNMSLYNYYKVNNAYDAYAVDSVSPGFGFIDAMMQNKTCAVGSPVGGRYDSIDVTNNDFQIRDLTLTGEVKSVVIDASTGNNYPMNTNINSNYFVAVGGLAGNIVYNSTNNTNATNKANSGPDIFKVAISHINLSNLKVNGVRNTGGLLGYNQSENDVDSKTTITNITTSDLEVSSGIHTGGLIGYSTQTALDISDVTIAEPNIKTYLNFATTADLTTNATGGIIGYAETNTNNGAVYLHDITIGAESPTSSYSAYIGYNEPGTYPTSATDSNKKYYETVRVGGLIGQVATNSSTMIASTGEDHIDYNTKIEKCNIYNVDMKGHKLGGLVGASETSTAYLGIFDTIVKSNQTSPKTLFGAKFATGSTGGIIGFTNYLNNRVTVQNCSVEGYKIESKQCTGGIFGNLKGNETDKAKICDVLVKDIRLASDNYSGALVGNEEKSLYGYNILTDNIQFKSFNDTPVNYGHIVGKLGSSQTIKIAGFARQNMSKSVSGYNQLDNMVNTGDNYGTGGYVIFADYYNTYKTGDQSTVASTVNDDDNVVQRTYRIDKATNEVNNFPYVTVSPKLSIENNNGRFLTGDAVIELSYNESVFKKIIDQNQTGVAGRYRNIPITNTNTTALNAISSKFSTSSAQMSGTGAPNIPLLVIEDADYTEITPVINNYIGVLTNNNINTKTNTPYNFAQDESGVYRTSLKKCIYNSGTYTIGDEGSACLKRNQIGDDWFFRMKTDDVDNETDGVFQFSLLDVQFLDPSDSTKVAYHLYVPIYVKKLLQYSFKAALISNTQYYAGAYGALNGNSLFENLGNPVTMKFEYIYSREPDEWKNAINEGENVLLNLYKTLAVEGGAWPTGTRMVLVDTNNKDKHYYLDNPPNSSTLALRDFIDDGGNKYDPAPLNNLMTVTVGQPSGVTRNLTPVTLTKTTESEKLAEAISLGATVYSNETYYRRITDADTGLTDADKYAVTDVSTNNTERYYLSIFIPKSENASIYHYQFTGSESFGKITTTEQEAYKNNGYRPNHIIEGTANNATVHFYTGDLYENTYSMNVTSKKNDRELNKGNNQIKVTMTSTVQLKSVKSEVEDVDPSSEEYDKTRKGLADNMRANAQTSEIYQAFLSTYDRVDTKNGLSNVGINMDAPPFTIIKSYKYYDGPNTSATDHDITAPDPNKNTTENYVVLANNVNIVGSLANINNEYAITFTLEYELNYYDENYIPAQFPANTTKDEDIGTKVIGYSNISSSKDGVAYSATSTKRENSPRYYAAGSTKASLQYNVKKTSGEMLGPYSYLGINPLDVPETEHEIKTIAQYDTHSITSSNVDYIDLSIKLSNKSSDYSTALPLDTYIKELKILGTSDDEIFISSWNNGTYHYSNKVYVTKTETEYKIRVHKSALQTQGTADSGRYILPINFTVYTGDSKFNNNTGGLMYSNYRVTVEASLWSAQTGGTRSEPSVASNYLIYTNAKIKPDVIRVN